MMARSTGRRKVASYRFPSVRFRPCVGNTYRNGAFFTTEQPPLSGVIVTLSNGYAGATNANGVYSFLVPPGTYTATAADADRNCTMRLACQSNRHHHQRWHDDPKLHKWSEVRISSRIASRLDSHGTASSSSTAINALI